MTPLQKRALIADNILSAGLGNRVRFLLSAQRVAEVEGRAFYWTWPTRAGVFEPHIHDLWHYDVGTELPADDVAAVRSESPALPEDANLYADGMADLDTWHLRSGKQVKARGGQDQWETLLRGLRPVEAITRRVDDLRASTPLGEQPYVGVMVRANDKTHRKTLDASPVEWFTDRMRAILDDSPQTAFFLSCDQPAVQDAVIAEFPSVYALDDKGGYNTTDGVRASIADLYLLAGSNHLLGPYWSSFVTLAWRLSGKVQDLENSRHTKRAVAPS